MPDPVTLEALQQKAADFQEESVKLKDGPKRNLRIGTVMNQNSALAGLIRSIKRWKATSDDDLPTLLKNLDSQSNDLAHIRSQGKLLGTLGNLVAYLDLSGDEELQKKVMVGLDILISPLPDDPSQLVSLSGNSWEGKAFQGADDPRWKNYKARDAAFLLALRYHLSGQIVDAEKVKRVLLRFGEVMPGWELFTRDGTAFSEKRNGEDWFAQYLKVRGANGLFGIWYPLEVMSAFPLAQAYALTANAMSEGEAIAIQTNTLEPVVKTAERFSFGVHNLLIFHMQGLFSWGRLLGWPDLVHRGVKMYERQLLEGFFPDGSWMELTPDYHRQVLTPLAYTIPELLAGYSDPPDYINGEDGTHYDNLDLRKKYGLLLTNALNAWADTLLPDHTSAAISDTEANRKTSFTLPLGYSRPRLLGASGLAVLGSGTGSTQSELYLIYKGTIGHQHQDALSILWYAHGLEVLSESTYRGPVESRQYRPWYRSAPAHHTVIVDERPQFSQKKDFAIPAGNSLWDNSGSFNNQGKLLTFDTTLPEAQFVEAEFVRAYQPLVSQYQRTVAYVPLEQGDGYVIDIFRVRGGKKHDYILRGGLNQPHTAKVSQSGIPFDKHLYDHIGIHTKYDLSRAVELGFKHANGVNMNAKILQPVNGAVSLLEGEAPAIRRNGTAPYFILRNQSQEGETGALGSTFVVVYDVSKSRSSIKSAKLRPVEDNPGAVVVEVEWKDRRDVLISSLEHDSKVVFADVQFQGTLGFLRYTAGKPVLAHLSAQGSLSVPGVFDLKARSADSGIVVQGSKAPLENRPIELDRVPGLSSTDKILHVDFGKLERFSYPITSQEGSRIRTAYPPGFRIGEEGFIMNRAPGWKGKDVVRWVIPHQATWRSNN